MEAYLFTMLCYKLSVIQVKEVFFLTHRCRASMGALKKVSKDCDLPFWSSWRWSNNGIRTRRSLPIIQQAMGPGEPVREVLATVVSGWGWRG